MESVCSLPIALCTDTLSPLPHRTGRACLASPARMTQPSRLTSPHPPNHPRSTKSSASRETHSSPSNPTASLGRPAPSPKRSFSEKLPSRFEPRLPVPVAFPVSSASTSGLDSSSTLVSTWMWKVDARVIYSTSQIECNVITLHYITITLQMVCNYSTLKLHVHII